MQRRPCLAALAAAALLLIGPIAHGGGRPESVFHIDRNKNRNQVHYGITVDDKCRPVGEEPLYNYWLRIDSGPPTTKPLKFFQQMAYGFQSQTVASDGRVEARMRAFPERLLTVRAAAAGKGKGCKAEAFLTIDGKDAYLDKVFVFAEEGILLPSVRYVELYGRSNDGHAVYEKITVEE
ncbi:MAG TPA: DUF4833 domain-containing protein [Candidatus Limnocylindrales bacterium]|nr:DUF4833 domain-containing protein [Candidatus Limnocylindrales bacterium]